MRAFAEGHGKGDFGSLTDIAWGNETVSGENYRLRGQLRLSGFDESRLPKGLGAEQVVVTGNEGDSLVDVVIDGGENIRRIDVQKFYASSDYQTILQRQLSQGTVVLMASACQ